jgi:hypothetical protein
LKEVKYVLYCTVITTKTKENRSISSPTTVTLPYLAASGLKTEPFLTAPFLFSKDIQVRTSARKSNANASSLNLGSKFNCFQLMLETTHTYYTCLAMVLSSDHSRQYVSSLSILAVALFVGVPIWWKTTEVYRCTLPYSEIHELRDRHVSTDHFMLHCMHGMQLRGRVSI